MRVCADFEWSLVLCVAKSTLQELRGICHLETARLSLHHFVQPDCLFHLMWHWTDHFIIISWFLAEPSSVVGWLFIAVFQQFLFVFTVKKSFLFSPQVWNREKRSVFRGKKLQNIRNISFRIRFFSRVKQNERKVGLLLIFREKKNLSKIKKNQRKIFFYGEKFILRK